MIFVEDLIKTLSQSDIKFYTGVPDSILKHLSFIIDKNNKKKNIVAVNEGSAVSIAAGYHLSTKKIPCVYLQNSGLGNALNPLVSITHKKVYSIPLLLLIGWRGSPGSKDEPQHNTKGKITPDILKLLNIKYILLDKKKDLAKIKRLIDFSRKNNNAVACLIKNNSLISKNKIKIKKNGNNFTRRTFILELLKKISKKTKIVSTTGYTSRELDNILKEQNFKKPKVFYMIGGMGHASAVALGSSLFTKKNTICLDGDGSILMHLGSLRTCAFLGNKNFKHIILNNNSHESVGGTNTSAKTMDFKYLSKSLGYKNFFLIKKKSEIKKKLSFFLKCKGPSLMNVLIEKGISKKLTRPKNFIKIKEDFMK